jgi:putative endonuclease
MFTVYVLQSEKDRRLYVGFTSNLIKRLDEHNKGRTKSTKGFRPWKIVYFEKANTRLEARNREKYLKSGIGKEKIKRFLKNNNSTDTYLSAGREQKFPKL